MKNQLNSLLLSLLIFVFCDNAFALAPNCIFKNARVSISEYISKSKSTNYFVSNLNKTIAIQIPDNQNDKLAQALRRSNADKNLFLNLAIQADACLLPPNLLINPISIRVDSVSKIPSQTDCVKCITFESASSTIKPPAMDILQKSLDQILAASAGVKAERINQASLYLIHLYERMNSKTPTANSYIFILSFIKSLETLGIKSINFHQLNFLVSNFQLTKDQKALLQTVFKKIDNINFTRNSLGQVEVKLLTLGHKKIEIPGKEIPNTYNLLEKIEIQNNTSLIFSNVSSLKNNPKDLDSITTPMSVVIKGITISTKISTSIPQEVNIDIEGDIPFKASLLNRVLGFEKITTKNFVD